MTQEELQKAMKEALKKDRHFKYLDQKDVNERIDTKTHVMLDFLKIENSKIINCFLTNDHISEVNGKLTFITTFNFVFENKESVFKYFNYEVQMYLNLK